MTDLAIDLAVDLAGGAKDALEAIGFLGRFRADPACVVDDVWLDRSENAYAADGTGHAPTYVESVAALGGRPAFSYNGVSQYQRLPATLAAALEGTDYWVLEVFARANASALHTLWSMGRTSATNNYLWRYLNSGAGGDQSLAHNDGSQGTYTGLTPVAAGAHYTLATYDDTADTLGGRLDGAPDGSNTQTRNPTAMDTGGIGALVRNSVAQYFEGHIAEIAWFAGVPTAEQIAAAEAYVQEWYGFPEPS